MSTTEAGRPPEGDIFRNLLWDMQIGVLLQGPDSEILLSNPKALELLGVSEDQLLGKTSFDPDWNVIHEDGSPFPGSEHPVPAAIASRKSVLNAVMGVFRPALKDRIWLSVDAVPELMADGTVRTVVCTFIDITQRKKAEDEVHWNALRLKRLVDVLQHPSETIQEFLDYSLEQAIQMTGSKIGYIYHYQEDEKKFILNTWSKNVMGDCRVINPQTEYDLDKTGIWGEAVRQRRAVIINDFSVSNPLKKGLPEGHVPLKKFMTLPVFRKEEIVGVVGLANKERSYGEMDILQVSLLMDVVWKVTERKAAEEKVKALLAEKELVLREVHHRIKNNMSTIYGLLSLQAATMKDQAAVTALEDAGRRVQSMMVLYNKLYQSSDVTTLSVIEYLPELVDDIVGNFPNSGSVKVEKKIEDFTLKAARLQSIGIIVNELLTNIMKYAFIGRSGGTIVVAASLEENRAYFAIEDDGNGIPEKIDFENSTGFGLVLVQALTKQLEGTIRIERGTGTKIILEFTK